MGEYNTGTIYLVMGIAFDFQYKRVRNGHRKEKYHILEKWFHVTQVKQISPVCNIS